jgi:glucose/mannose-6-phosphate isomerase
MLDDLKRIHQRDKSDALGVAEKQWRQYQHQFAIDWTPPREICNVVIAGMGGSGLAAKTLLVWPQLARPLAVAQGYELPSFMDEHTLVIFSSYSGNTEETLACYQDASASASVPMRAVVASGGKLAELAARDSVPVVSLPSGLQPRMTFGYQLGALVQLFEHIHLLQNASEQLASASEWLAEEIASWRPDAPASKNLAKQLALELAGKSIVIYGGPLTAPAAYKWKISFNENAKHVAWWNQYPEFNHNEFIGWTQQPVQKPYAIIDLRSRREHPQIQKRFDASARLLSGRRPAPLTVETRGENIISEIMYLIALGDFVSIYLALLSGIDPTPVDLIEKLKQQLAKHD